MRRSGGRYQKELNMAGEIFDRLVAELFPHVYFVDLRGWGESTILPDFEHRVQQTLDAGPRIRLVTNVLALRPCVWKRLMDGAASVVVSVDAATANTMGRLGRGNFERLLRSLEAGAQAREMSANPGKIAFNTVTTTANLDELSSIARLAGRFGVHRITLFPVVAERSDPLHLEHRKSDVPSRVAEAEATARELGIELRMGASLCEEFVVSDALPSRCSHPWAYCHIDYAGRVGYCDHLIGDEKFMLGNLAQASFAEIWNGPDFVHLREAHAQMRAGAPGPVATAYPHCAWCYKRRYVDFEDDTHGDAVPRLVSTRGRLPLITQAPPPYERSDFRIT
jgi:radical SAM protein with 4Fe4S-binding SPASM domain